MERGRALFLSWLRFQREIGVRWISHDLKAAVVGDRGGDRVEGVAMDPLVGPDRECAACPIHRSGRKRVLGEGEGRIMVVVDPPGAMEEARNEAISGPPRELLVRMLEAIGLKLSDVYLTPALKCRPAPGGPPPRSALEACREVLRGQVDVMASTALLVMGPVAGQVVLGRGVVYWRMRKRVHEVWGVKAVITHGPSQILPASPGEQRQLKREVWQDLQLFQRECLR